MNIWDKTELEVGQDIIDEYVKSKKQDPLILITDNKITSNLIEKYASERYSTENIPHQSEYTSEDFQKALKSNEIKAYKIMTRQEENKIKDLNRKGISNEETKTYNIILATSEHHDLKLYVKGILREKSGYNTGLLSS